MATRGKRWVALVRITTKDFELFFLCFVSDLRETRSTIQVGPASRGVYVSMNVLAGVQPGNAHPPPVLSVCTLVSFLYTLLQRYRHSVLQVCCMMPLCVVPS